LEQNPGFENFVGRRNLARFFKAQKAKREKYKLLRGKIGGKKF